MSINMNDKSRVKNLCPWSVSWEKINSTGDELLKANATVYMDNAEIEVQIQNGNAFLCGTDGLGSHARVYIENPELREYFKFDDKDAKRAQFILDDERCQQIFDYKTISTFDKHLKESIITNQEKSKIVAYAKKIKLNDYEKIKLIELHCEVKFN